MLVILTSVFIISWLPYNLYFFYSFYQPQVFMSPFTKDVYLGLYWLAMANSAVIPVIYYWMCRK